MKRLLIVADHALVADAIRLALRQTAGFELIGFVDGRHGVGTIVAENRPDIVLIDDMQRPDIALLRVSEVAGAAPDATCILLTLQMARAGLELVFEAGADAVISKTVDSASLGTLLRETARGAVVHRFRAAAQPAATPDLGLTRRELEVLGYVASGQTNACIARELWITEQTVKFHLSNAYRKLGVANRTEASRFAHVHRLLAPSTDAAVTAGVK